MEVSPSQAKCASPESKQERAEASWSGEGSGVAPQRPQAGQPAQECPRRNGEQPWDGEGRFMGRRNFLCRESSVPTGVCTHVHVSMCASAFVYCTHMCIHVSVCSCT